MLPLHPPLTKRDLCSKLHSALRVFRATAANGIANNSDADLEIRVVVDVGDETWWLATGDVQYDTVHGDLCAAGTLSVTATRADVTELATELLNEIESQHEDWLDEQSDLRAVAELQD